MNSWDKRWIELALFVAEWSKDRSRKVGAVIVDGRNTVVSLGWNGFPRGIDDDVEERHERPAKYLWTEHAERNAIYNAASNGDSLRGCKIYLPWYPCAECARAIIQSGINEVICVEPDWNDETYKADFAIVAEMFGECPINVRYVEGVEPPKRK